MCVGCVYTSWCQGGCQLASVCMRTYVVCWSFIHQLHTVTNHTQTVQAVLTIPPESPAQDMADMQTLLHNLVNAALTDVGTLARAVGQPVDASGSPPRGLAGELLAAARQKATMGVVVLGHVSPAIVHLEGSSVSRFFSLRFLFSLTCCVVVQILGVGVGRMTILV